MSNMADFQFDDELKSVFTDDVLATYRQMPYEMLVASAVLMKSELQVALDGLVALQKELTQMRQVLVSVIHLTGVTNQPEEVSERPLPGQYL